MRIAIMTDSYLPTIDGVVTAVLVTRKALEDMGHTVFILAPDPGDEKYREKGVYYFRSIEFRSYKGYRVPLFPSDKTEIIRKLHPDVIHIRGIAFMALKGLMASHNTGIPTVLTYETNVTDVIQQYSPVKLPNEVLVHLARSYLRGLLARPTVVTVPSESTRGDLTKLGVETKDLEVVPTGIDTVHFSRTDDTAIRERYGLTGKRVIISVGRVSFEKNDSLLVRSMKLMDPDVVLLVCGNGPAMEDLKKITAG